MSDEPTHVRVYTDFEVKNPDNIDTEKYAEAVKRALDASEIGKYRKYVVGGATLIYGKGKEKNGEKS